MGKIIKRMFDNPGFAKTERRLQALALADLAMHDDKHQFRSPRAKESIQASLISLKTSITKYTDKHMEMYPGIYYGVLDPKFDWNET